MSSATSPLQQPGRLQWVDGSALGARDLRDAIESEESMLALHMRALHDTWGVALGLSALLSADSRSVLVTPGFAITCQGMSILLPTATQAGAPRDTGHWDLLLHAPAASEGDACIRPTTCELDITPRVATLRWRRSGEKFDHRQNVVLAQFTRQPNGLLDGPDLSGRRGVRVLERPHISGGVVAAGALSWTANGNVLTASIDTSTAGFSRPAIYRVWVATHAPWPTNVTAAFLSVVSASRTAANLQLLVPGGASMSSASSVADSLSIGWLGVEPVRGCPPSFSLRPSPLIAGLGNFSQWSTALAAVPGFQP